MNGDVEYQLEGGHVSFDTLWRLDQLAATLHGSDGWQIRVEVYPGVVLTATPARGLHTAGTPWRPSTRSNRARTHPREDQDAPEAAGGRTA